MNGKPLYFILPLLLAACFWTSASAGGKDKTPLEGTWKGGDDGKKGSITFTGSKWKLEIKDDKEHFASGTFTIDATKTPKTMDLMITDAGGEPEKYKGKTSKAIYEIDGNKLKWSAGEPGKDQRPTDFVPGMGLFIVFERVKK